MKTNLIDNRQIRVFISSTFQDMQDERDYLMKRTFPKLRKLAAERDVTLTELDLRWGITEEEAKTGKVVEICLREIENSIPFFIGIIGNRYGWVPEKNDLSANVTERFPDVNTFIGQHLSVTEMEMQFGVLQREEDMHAYFFIKNKMEEQDNPEMLNRLKAEVEASRYPSSTYSSPENLAEQVEQAFIALLDQLFPEGNISELEKERIGQRSFMHQLCQNYIRDDKNFKVLDDWVHDWEQHQLVITGASGLGKSALIANWVNEKLQDKDRGYNIIYHFTGNGGSESHHEHIMKVLIGGINDVYGWENEENTDQSQEDKLKDLFLKVASEGKKPLLIVLDAVNQIIDTDDAKFLNWLPIPPRNIKILFSTLEDDCTMEVFRNRHYPEFILQPLDAEKRRQLVTEYLWLYRKKLTEAQIEHIVTDKQSENTHVLKTLLDELINYGVFEKLDERIDYYLLPDTIEDFYQALLQSYEDDFGKDFVKQILSLIAVSRNGLSEKVILAITGYKQLYWSQFYCAFHTNLNNKKGQIGFSHNNISQSVNNRYLVRTNWEKTCRKKILENALLNINKRLYMEDLTSSFLEVPYQLLKMEDGNRLFKVIKDPNTAVTIYALNSEELRNYWRYLLSRGYHLKTYLETNLDTSDLYLYQKKGRQLLSLIREFGENVLASKIAERKLNIILSADNVSTVLLAQAYTDAANHRDDYRFQHDDNYYEQVFDYYLKAIELSTYENLSQKSNAYNGLANLCIDGKKYDWAIKFLEKALEINKDLYGKNHIEVAINLDGLSQAFYFAGQTNRAIESIKEAISIVEEYYLNDVERLPWLYYHLACYLKENDIEDAMKYIKKAIKMKQVAYGAIYEGKDIFESFIEEIDSVIPSSQ